MSASASRSTRKVAPLPPLLAPDASDSRPRKPNSSKRTIPPVVTPAGPVAIPLRTASLPQRISAPPASKFSPSTTTLIHPFVRRGDSYSTVRPSGSAQGQSSQLSLNIYDSSASTSSEDERNRESPDEQISKPIPARKRRKEGGKSKSIDTVHSISTAPTSPDPVDAKSFNSKSSKPRATFPNRPVKNRSRQSPTLANAVISAAPSSSLPPPLLTRNSSASISSFPSADTRTESFDRTKEIRKAARDRLKAQKASRVEGAAGLPAVTEAAADRLAVVQESPMKISSFEAERPNYVEEPVPVAGAKPLRPPLLSRLTLTHQDAIILSPAESSAAPKPASVKSLRFLPQQILNHDHEEKINSRRSSSSAQSTQLAYTVTSPLVHQPQIPLPSPPTFPFNNAITNKLYFPPPPAKRDTVLPTGHSLAYPSAATSPAATSPGPFPNPPRAHPNSSFANFASPILSQSPISGGNSPNFQGPFPGPPANSPQSRFITSMSPPLAQMTSPHMTHVPVFGTAVLENQPSAPFPTIKKPAAGAARRASYFDFQPTSGTTGILDFIHGEESGDELDKLMRRQDVVPAAAELSSGDELDKIVSAQTNSTTRNRARPSRDPQEIVAALYKPDEVQSHVITTQPPPPPENEIFAVTHQNPFARNQRFSIGSSRSANSEFFDAPVGAEINSARTSYEHPRRPSVPQFTSGVITHAPRLQPIQSESSDWLNETMANFSFSDPVVSRAEPATEPPAGTHQNEEEVQEVLSARIMDQQRNNSLTRTPPSASPAQFSNEQNPTPSAVDPANSFYTHSNTSSQSMRSQTPNNSPFYRNSSPSKTANSPFKRKIGKMFSSPGSPHDKKPLNPRGIGNTASATIPAKALSNSSMISFGGMIGNESPTKNSFPTFNGSIAPPIPDHMRPAEESDRPQTRFISSPPKSPSAEVVKLENLLNSFKLAEKERISGITARKVPLATVIGGDELQADV